MFGLSKFVVSSQNLPHFDDASENITSLCFGNTDG